MSDWTKVSRAEAMAAVDAGTHEVRCLHEPDGNYFKMNRDNEYWSPGSVYEIRPIRKMVEKTICYPEPLRVKPGTGDTYWMPSPDFVQGYTFFPWEDEAFDNRIFDRGMCFATEEDVKELCRALWGDA